MTYDEIIKKWNAEADEYNQWTELDTQEKVEFGFLCGTKWAGLNEEEINYAR